MHICPQVRYSAFNELYAYATEVFLLLAVYCSPSSVRINHNMPSSVELPPPPPPSPHYASSSSQYHNKKKTKKQYTEKDFEDIYYHFDGKKDSSKRFAACVVLFMCVMFILH